MDTVIFPTNYAIFHLNSKKLTKSCRSVQLAIDGKRLVKESASVIILFPQKAKHCGETSTEKCMAFCSRLEHRVYT